MKRLLITTFIMAFAFINVFTEVAEASYRDNPKDVYYDLSELVYQVEGTNTISELNNLTNQLNSRQGTKDKFEVIDTINVDHRPFHPASSGGDNFAATGFKAMTVIIKREVNPKLYIVFAGTDKGLAGINDAKAAGTIANSITPGQNHQAQLYVNYIYKRYKDYQNYSWYFTGHSLGGWLASKVYLDIRAARWLTYSSQFTYGGAIGKTASGIKGVFTFNPLPIGKNHVSKTQWDANKNGVYDHNINNMYIKNEWLHAVQTMRHNELAYFGNRNERNTGISSYQDLSYNGDYLTLQALLVDYAQKAAVRKPSITNAHRLAYMKQYLRPWSQVPLP